MKLGTDIHHVSGRCWKGFHESEVSEYSQSNSRNACTLCV